MIVQTPPLRSIIDTCLFGTQVYLSNDQEDITKQLLFIKYNSEVLNSFPHIVFAVNRSDNADLIAFQSKYREYISTPTTWIDMGKGNNRGHVFGTTDLDLKLIEYFSSQDTYDTLVKSANDMITYPRFLNTKFIESDKDFYYLPSMSYESLTLDYNPNPEYWLPQSNLFILKKKIMDLGKWQLMLDTLYDDYVSKGKVGKTWEMYTFYDFQDKVKKFDLENIIKDIILSNECNIKNILTEDTMKKLKEYISTSYVGDPSHKNILFKEVGVCHLHNIKSSPIIV